VEGDKADKVDKVDKVDKEAQEILSPYPMPNAPCPMPHAQKFHPQAGGVFHIALNNHIGF
jgi:hypothetical protein